MILKSLYDYYHTMHDAGKVPDLGYELKEIEFIVVIDKNGKFVRFESQRIDKKRCKSFLVPGAIQRSGTTPKPNLLWDNLKYVFGLETGQEQANAVFISKINEILSLNPNDEALKSLSKFYQQDKDLRNESIRSDELYENVREAKASNFSFRMEGEDKLIAEKTYILPETRDDDCNEGICMVTGNRSQIARTFTPTPIPNNSPMASLVAFQVNSGYDSYGKRQAVNASISVEAEMSISAALKYLLSKDSKNKSRLGDRMFLYWGSVNDDNSKEVEEALSFLLDLPDKTQKNPNENILNAKKIFKSIFSGEIRTSTDDTFHVLGLAPNVGRIAVVMWMECSLKEFAGKIYRHFEDMEIIDIRKEDQRKAYYGAFSILSASTQSGKTSDALPNLVDELVKSIFYGLQYPFRLYTSILDRVRAELPDRSVSVVRAAIIKAYLNRNNNNSNQKKISVMLDKSNTNPGYLCGRLAATLEKIQKDAGRGDNMRTRYMGAASSAPASVFPTMLNVSIHHSENLSEGSRIYYEQIKQEIIDLLPVDGFPAHLDINDQGRFFIGYYHQNADFYTAKDNK